MEMKFDELEFFAMIKKRPGMYMGQKSLLSLRDQLFGMIYAFSACGQPSAMRYFSEFVDDYNGRLFLNDRNGYVCWWNHLLYVSGNMDNHAFDAFFQEFEAFLAEKHALQLPDVK